MKRLCFLILAILLTTSSSQAQDMAAFEDSETMEILIKTPEKELKKDKKQVALPKDHNPKKATWLALIPGAGQAYNRKYWKMPIVYAGFGVTGYLAIFNGHYYHIFRDAYDYKMGINLDVSDEAKEWANTYSGENLITERDYYRRNMELSWIVMAVWYGLQIIDASVDAHFFYFDVDDNISIQVDPKWEPTFTDCAYGYGNGFGTAGLSVKMNF